MKNLKKYFFIGLVVFASGYLIPSNAIACCTVCFGGGQDECYEFEGSCINICCACTCSNSSDSRVNPATDYILAIKGQPAYIVNGRSKIKIASDNMAAFNSSMNARYPGAKKEDPKLKKEIADAWAVFFKKPDNHSVSADRLSALSSETGLKVRTSEKG